MNNVIKRVWNQNKMVQIEDLQGMTFQAETAGHTFEIAGIDDAGEALTLTGTPAGVFLRPDNTDVALTCSVTGGKVYATLPGNCYDVPGRFAITIFLTSDSQKTALYAGIGTVSRTSSGTAAPGTTQSVVDLINAINAAVNSIPADYSSLLADIAPTYSNSALYSVGQYAWYDGDLKRCIVPITTAESYTAAHWTSAVLGNDVSDLKSALNASGILLSGEEYTYNNIVFTENMAVRASDGAIISGRANGYAATIDYYFIPPGTTKIETNAPTWEITSADYACIAFYDESKTLISGATMRYMPIDVLPSYKYVRLTIYKANRDFTGYYIKLKGKFDIIDKCISVVNGKYRYNAFNIQPGKMISRTDGTIINGASANYGAAYDFIPIPEGTERIESNAVTYTASAGGVAFYDENGTFLYGSAGFGVEILPTYKYLRFTHNKPADGDFTGIYVDMIGHIKKVDDQIADIEQDIEWLANHGVTWTHQYINGSGAVVDSNDYCLSSMIPMGLIEKIETDGRTLNYTLYFKSGSFFSNNYSSNGIYEPDLNNDFGYVRIWFAESDFDNLDSDVRITYGIQGWEQLRQKLGVTGELAYPTKLYMLSGIEYDLFLDNLVKYKDASFIRAEGRQPWYTANTVINTGRAAYIPHPESVQDARLVAKLYMSTTGARYASKEANIVISNKTTDTGNIYVQVVGDSFTDMSPSWIDYILAENLCPNIHFVGICKNKLYQGQYHEGRGGWTMEMYARPATGTGLDGNVYAGFWQPNGNYKYWGDKRFWKNVKDGATALEDFDASKFDSNGYLNNPTTNDIMYDGTNFIKWDGDSWETVQETDYTWGFDYAKYLSMWGITSPSICAVMLGMNDFREEYTDAKWNTMKTLLDTFIASYYTAVPTGKFVAVIHCTDTGRNWNHVAEMRTPAEAQNLNLWNYRKNMIDAYDGKEADGIWLCDAGIMVDGVYGYETEERLPFSTYTGSERIKLQLRNPHPTLAFSAMSLPFAAIIQHLRAQ